MSKRWFAAITALAIAATLTPDLSEAKRLGGGGSLGMQRQAPARSTPQSPPPQPGQPANAAPTSPTAANPAAAGAAGATAAAAGKRSWLGPIAGLAAGLGLAALMSHLGMGEGMANVLMIALLAMAAIFVVRLVMSRMGGSRTQGALAGAGGGQPTWNAGQAPATMRPEPSAQLVERSALQPAGADVSVTGVALAPVGAPSGSAAPVAPAGLTLPEGFDLPAFERVAKMIFIRLQAANDAGDLDDLREFTTPEMFAAIRLDLQERAGAAQHTDVERVDAQVIDFVQEPTRQVVSVRFHGLVREDKASPPVALDEVWHLVKPADDSRTWAIAGIQQPQ